MSNNNLKQYPLKYSKHLHFQIELIANQNKRSVNKQIELYIEQGIQRDLKSEQKKSSQKMRA